MKLSQMSTDQAANAYCVLAPALENIIKSEQAVELVDEFQKSMKSDDIRDWISFILTRVLPVLLGSKHRKDAALIIAAMTEKTEQEVLSQLFMQTLKDVRDFIDEDFIDFFKQSVQQVRN